MSNDLQYVADALNDGFTACVVIMAVVTAFLTFVAYSLGKDDKIEEEKKEVE